MALALQNRACFETGEKGEKTPRKREKEGQKGEKDAWKEVSQDLGAKTTNKQKTRNKHSSDGPCGTIVQGRTPARPRDKRDKMAILLWNQTEKAGLSQERVPICPREGSPFVPGTVLVCPGDSPAQNVYLGKSKGGAHKRGLEPQTFKKIGQLPKTLPGNRAFSGQIGAFSGPIGLFGADRDRFLCTAQPAEIAPKGPFLAQLAPFGLSPRLLSPRLDFPDLCLLVFSLPERFGLSVTA